MGAMSFSEIEWSKTPEEAFAVALMDACHQYGYGGYTGTLAEKESFIMIDVPDEWRGKEEDYAYHLIEEDDERISDKHGPAGCIILESKDSIEKVPYATTVERYEQKGTRKWETYFKVEAVGGGSFRTFSSQTDAEKFAKEWVKNNNQPAKIRIGKRLVNGDQNIMVVRPKTKDVKVKGGDNKYIFFGWASS